MKKLTILSFLILAVAVGGFAQTKKKLTKAKGKSIPAKVKSAPAPKNSTNMNGQMMIALKQSAVDNASGIKIEFTALLEDSRCPEGVNCIWAGNAKVQISVSKNGASGQTIELNTNLPPQSVSYQGYTIKLAGLTPYPKDGVDSSKTQARAGFSITKE